MVIRADLDILAKEETLILLKIQPANI